MEILIENLTNDIEVSDKIELEITRAIKTTLEHLDYFGDYEISVSIVDEDEIKNLNNEYRGKDSVTDVLSFPLFERGEIPNSGMLGDVVICSKRVIDQAEEFGHSLEREISYLTVHSVLHLLGFDHIDEDEKIEMRNYEKEIMKKLEIFK